MCSIIASIPIAKETCLVIDKKSLNIINGYYYQKVAIAITTERDTTISDKNKLENFTTDAQQLSNTHFVAPPNFAT